MAMLRVELYPPEEGTTPGPQMQATQIPMTQKVLARSPPPPYTHQVWVKNLPSEHRAPAAERNDWAELGAWVGTMEMGTTSYRIHPDQV